MQTLIPPKSNSLWRFAAGAGLAFAVGLVLFYLVMAPAAGDLALMVELMGATTLISVLAAYMAYRSGWITRSPHLRWTLAVGFFMAEAVSARIQQVNDAARQVARGNLDTRLVVSGKDEMATLAGSFNEMVAQLQAAERSQQQVDVLRRELVAWAGHDLRTPLTSLRAVLSALADGLVEDEATRLRYLHTAQKDVQDLSHLIDDLFEMAQVDAGGMPLNLERGSIGDLISDTLERFSAQAGQQGISLRGSAAAGVDPVTMDSQRIGRVLSNLVSNALRHTPTGGQVTLKAVRQESWLNVSVEDSGEGIRPEDLPFVFERFYRGEKSRSRATGGAGLGLAIAKGIVAAHGGSIGIESEVGKGTKVWFQIPVG